MANDNLIEPYYLEQFIEFEAQGECLLMEIQTTAEDGFGWVNGEGQLDNLVGLHADIVAGDYRLLYLDF